MKSTYSRATCHFLGLILVENKRAMPAGTEEKITFLAKEVIKAPVLQTLCELINPVMRSGDKLKMFYSKSMYRAKSRIPIADRA